MPTDNQFNDLDYDKDAEFIRYLNLPQMEQRSLTELEGICAAIIHDGVITADELTMLSTWLNSRGEFRRAWPMCKVCDRVDAIVAARAMTDAAHDELLKFMSSIAADAAHSGHAGDALFDSDVTVTFAGKMFLFTGAMGCLRNDAMNAVVARGGMTCNTPSRKVDYLVVGDLGSEAWQHSRYGTKIQKIMENKLAGIKISIIQESVFKAAVECVKPVAV